MYNKNQSVRLIFSLEKFNMMLGDEYENTNLS